MFGVSQHAVYDAAKMGWLPRVVLHGRPRVIFSRKEMDRLVTEFGGAWPNPEPEELARYRRERRESLLRANDANTG
jgi:hypothetical protein